MTVTTSDAQKIEMLIEHLSSIEQIRRGAGSRLLSDHEKNISLGHKRAAKALLIALFTDLEGPFDHPLAKSPNGA